MNRSFGLPVILFGALIVAIQSQIAAALTPTQIAEKAQQITVRIDGPDDPSSGSGVIAHRQGNIYYVITNAHVVLKALEKGKYTIHTSDGKQYPIESSQVRHPKTKVDLAVLQFTSNRNYQVAEPGNSDQIKNATNVYVAGFPLPGPTIKQRIYRFLSGSISGRLPIPESGYELVYEVAALPGMSGGPVLNEQGQVVGINGLAIPDVRTGAVSVVGIPINSYWISALAAATQHPSNDDQIFFMKENTLQQLLEAGLKLMGSAADQSRQQKPVNTNTIAEITGFIEYENGNVEEAIKSWREALVVNNKNANALLALAVALYTKGNRQEGINLGKQAFQIDNRYGYLSFLKQRGWDKRLLADTAKFITDYQR